MLRKDGLYQRGPDEQNVIMIKPNILIGHSRLAILDLSPTGRQPMVASSGRYTISYNGEIYNYKFLASELLQGYKFKGSSDTEVLLALIDQFGLDYTLSVIDGDYAFVLVDLSDNTSYLVRDRLGCKPLYYYRDDDHLCVSSRIDAIHKLLSLKPVPDYDTINEYFNCGFGSESSFTWFKNIKRVPPGSYLKITHFNNKITCTDTVYHRPEMILQKSLSLHNISESSNFSAVLDQAIKDRLNSDRPVSVALSGGLDSTSIFLYACSSVPNIVAISFFNSNSKLDEQDKIYYKRLESIDDESLNASMLALSFNVPLLKVHNERPFINNLTECIRALESGHSSTSIVHALDVYRRAASSSAVILEGQGADEILGGYLLKTYPYFLVHCLCTFNLKSAFKLTKYIFSIYKPQTCLSVFLRDLRLNPFNRIYSLLRGSSEILQFKPPREKHFSPSLTSLFSMPLGNHLIRSQNIGLCNLLQYGDALAMNFSIENRNPYLSFRITQYVLRNLTKLIPLGRNKPLVRDYISSKGLKDATLPKVKMGFPNQIVKEFSSVDTAAIQILLSERCLSRTFWSGDALKAYIYRYLKLSRKLPFSLQPILTSLLAPDYNLLYKALSIELWHREFID